MLLRQIAAPIVGILVGSVIVALVETAGRAVFRAPPAPSGDATAMRAYVAALPVGALATVVAGWWLGSFAGVWAAVLVAARRPRLHAGIVVGVLLLATVANLVMLPHPLWMTVLGPLGILVAGWLAMRVGARTASR